LKAHRKLPEYPETAQYHPRQRSYPDANGELHRGRNGELHRQWHPEVNSSGRNNLGVVFATLLGGLRLANDD
jgi:hypothetical protein